MRTTVTLDADVVAGVRRIEAERGVSFKVALNSAIRAGLGAIAEEPARPYEVETFHAKLRPGVDLRRLNRLLADIEDDEQARKVELGK